MFFRKKHEKNIMEILFHDNSKEFHLTNDKISYVMKVLYNGQIGQLYYGSKIHDRESFAHLFETQFRPMVCGPKENPSFAIETAKQEYPSFGTGDYRNPAFEIYREDGSYISDFKYVGHEIMDGKPALEKLPATYVEDGKEAKTLEIYLKDEVLNAKMTLRYTIFRDYPVIARSVIFENVGSENLKLTKAMSMCLDLPDYDYDWVQFSGAWARERVPVNRPLASGVQSIESMRGHSSANQNPFVILKRKTADEFKGEVLGFSFVYSGNFIASAEVDTYDTTRFLMGINPRQFTWDLVPGEKFNTPEVVMAYSNEGLNGMSQTYHDLYRNRLARGQWRDEVRPILLNNWEATYMDFNEEKILNIAKKAKEAGVELFVLDDGWFGARNNDYAGLGDWQVNMDKLENGITGLAQKVEDMGLKFGLWFEPEMVNEDSDLYRTHPDWVLATPQRAKSEGRHQLVLDFSRKEVVDAIYDMMAKILSEAKISYIKWDMNRSITECYSAGYPANKQGEIYHRYILGVYDLYERLTSTFPHVLFESCASGGSRFDAGMLYYAPQCWTSDDTDAVERLKIQYGTSYGYPIVSMGSHVSVSPNHQLYRVTPIETRANVAYFGTFGYELDLNKLTDEEFAAVKGQVKFMKEYRKLIQFGDFYRLQSPYTNNRSSWMVVSKDKKEAIVAYFKVLNEVNVGFDRTYLKGLNPDVLYEIEGMDNSFYGDELMNAGLVTTDPEVDHEGGTDGNVGDFQSRLYILKQK